MCKISNLVRLSLCSLVVFFAAYAVPTVSAQGVIIPSPCRRCPQPPRPVPPVNLPRALPIKSIKIDAKIKGQVATTHVEQVFRNDTDQTLEGTYFFPIPDEASIVEFAIWDGDKRLVGEVRSREEARRIYDEIVRRQRDPGLLEYAGKNLFQASIFPIAPRSDKKLELTYSQVLTAESGTVNYRYPLGTGRNTATIGTVAGSIEIDARESVRNVYSPSHQIDVNRGGAGRTRVSFEKSASQTAQDFQLFYTLSRADFGMSLLTYREPGKDGYFLLMVAPKDDFAESEYAAKDIVFVLDTSGSMSEAGKMEKARAALQFGVANLRDADRFNVVAFAGEERLMTSGMIQSDAAGRRRGAEFVRGLRPVGGTNIDGALQAALKQFDRSDRPKMIVFMTDGLPTVGETNATRIVENVRERRGGDASGAVRLFTFGVGYDVNTALLDKLAAENGGVADYVEPKEDIEIKVSNFFTKINSPVLTDLELQMGGIETELVYPRRLSDIFRGSQLTMIGRYKNAGERNVRISLTGRAGRERRTFNYDDARFPFNDERNDFLPRLWATRRVGWLMEQVKTNGEQKELRDEIVDLGTRFGIVTPYTSFLALESNQPNSVATDSSNNRLQRERRPSGAGGGARRAAPSATATTGEAAVQQSKQARAQQEAARDDDEAMRVDTNAVRRVGDKTFYLRDGVWTDAEYKPASGLPQTSVSFGGEEYFALLKREPKLAEFFALGERVVVVYKNQVYLVNATK